MTILQASFLPKASMCMNCVHMKRDCSDLSFPDMPWLIVDDNRVGELLMRTIIVRCTGYVPARIERDQHRRRETETEGQGTQ